MLREEFENLINAAVEALPLGIQKKLSNVEIILEEGESPFDFAQGDPERQPNGSPFDFAQGDPERQPNGSPNNSLFGLYHGVSQLKRGSSYGMGMVLPDKITIWKGTIEKFSQGESQIPSLVRRVVWHEIGHHFGFDEQGIRKLEEKWARENKL